MAESTDGRIAARSAPATGTRESQAREDPGPKVFHEDVGLRDELVEDTLAGLSLEVEIDAALSAGVAEC